MLNWIKDLLGLTPNPYIGLFTEWKADRFTATSPDRVYSVWIGNGLYGFKDYSSGSRVEKVLISCLPRRQRRLVYKALIHDIRESSIKNLKSILEEKGYDVSN